MQHLCKLGDALLKELIFALVRIGDDFPDKLANFGFKVLIVTCPRKLLQEIEVLQVKQLGWSRCDLSEQEVLVHLFKMV